MNKTVFDKLADAQLTGKPCTLTGADVSDGDSAHDTEARQGQAQHRQDAKQDERRQGMTAYAIG